MYVLFYFKKIIKIAGTVFFVVLFFFICNHDTKKYDTKVGSKVLIIRAKIFPCEIRLNFVK